MNEAVSRMVAAGYWRVGPCSVCGVPVIFEQYAPHNYEVADPGERHVCDTATVTARLEAARARWSEEPQTSAVETEEHHQESDQEQAVRPGKPARRRYTGGVAVEVQDAGDAQTDVQ